MTTRRAAYRPGSGLLFVTDDRLLFIEDAGHPARAALFAAAASDCPLHSMAAAIAAAASAVPPLVFLQQRGELDGMAVGSIEVAVDGSETSVTDGDAEVPWSQISGAGSAVVSLGDEVSDLLWIDSGVVPADAFRWAPAPDAEDTITPIAPEEPSEDETRLVAPLAVEARAPASAPIPPTPASTGNLDSSTVGAKGSGEVGIKPIGQTTARTSVTEPLETEADLTIEAIRLAAMRQDWDAESVGCALTPPRADATEHQPTVPSTPSRTQPTERVNDPAMLSGIDPGQPSGFRAGEVVPKAVRRDETVEALVCSSCGRPNPPMTASCRGCTTVLAGGQSEHRLIVQPTLGVVHLADGRIEPLDADIVIGRNPAREPLGSHQRAVVHGEGNRYMSRRHVELRRAGWIVAVLNLKEGPNTTVESRRGGHAPLPVGVPHTLKDGDTVHFGRSWLRYEERL